MKLRDITATSMGNILEWFDFGLFIYCAPILGDIFFHTSSLKSSTLAAFGVFAAGYICRPIGGILFGYFGDTIGRVTSLRSSILIMSLATLGVGILPGFQTIGMMAPILFTLIRMIQGISAGGEYCGIMIYLAESASFKQRGFITSFAGSGANLGFLLASFAVIVLKETISPVALSTWGWRVPFIILGIFGIFIFIYRMKLTETTAYNYLRNRQLVDQKPLLIALSHAPRDLLKITGLTCMSSTLYILFFGYMSKFLPQFSSISSLLALSMQSIFLLCMLFLIPLGGMLGDVFGRKKLLFINCCVVILTIVPCFYLLLSQNIFLIAAAFFFATILSSIDQGNNLATFVENCPVDVRYSGIGFAYNIGNAIFGGTAPLIFSLLITNISPIAPAYYLIACGLISLLAVITLRNKEQVQDIGYFASEDVSASDNLTSGP
jgi:MHS family proline/betaine transporter-like MFS transporter